MYSLTEEQELLSKYLRALEVSAARRIYLLGILWEIEATGEMLQYIADTKETNHEKLIEAAKKISQKYKREDDE